MTVWLRLGLCWLLEGHCTVETRKGPHCRAEERQKRFAAIFAGEYWFPWPCPSHVHVPMRRPTAWSGATWEYQGMSVYPPPPAAKLAAHLALL